MKTIHIDWNWENPVCQENRGHNQDEWGTRSVVPSSEKTTTSWKLEDFESLPYQESDKANEKQE